MKNDKNLSDNMFEPDEMKLLKVDPVWSIEELLATEGLFFLKDVVGPLEIDTLHVLRHRKKLKADSKPWEVMGLRKMWNHWVVRMSVFASCYREHLRKNYRSIDTSWDSNQLMKQEGHFLLTDVCKLIPFTVHQIRYQSIRNPNTKTEYGVWKDDGLNRYMVEMALFRQWIKKTWMGNLSN